MKLFLLLAGSYDKPNTHTGDWVGTFKTREDAELYIDEIKNNGCRFRDGDLEWFRIVDLNQWIH